LLNPHQVQPPRLLDPHLRGKAVTDVEEVSVTCAICGQQSRQTIVHSTSNFGSPDLDLRPPPLKRQTMTYWVQECPHCRYVAARISHAEPGAHEFMRGDRWKALRLSAPGKSRSLSELFLVHSVIQEAIGNLEKAAFAALHAAWDADDRDDPAIAKSRRRSAADLFERAFAQGQIGSAEESIIRFILVDILRRAQCWEEAVKCCQQLDAAHLDPILQTTLRYQRHLCEARDAMCYDLASAKAFAKRQSAD
jgi:hypothetical protein